MGEPTGGAALFKSSTGANANNLNSMKNAPMGVRTNSGRYKMPLLPGEKGPKAGGNWVPGGLQSMTNLASSISDTKALGEWLLEQALIGVALHPELADELRRVVYAARERGVNFQELKLEPDKRLRHELAVIAERAKDISGANAARDAGIVRHDAWEACGKSGGRLFNGTAQINAEMAKVRSLLDAAGFEIVPDLVERTVRNVALRAAGRFDNILLHRRTGKLYVADLKTKRKPFWTWLETDAQLSGYANSEYMLEFETPPEEYEGVQREHVRYVSGPVSHVDLTEGVILHMPSDGSEPRLRRADLVSGWKTMQLARDVCTQRSYGSGAARAAESWWPVP